MPKGVGQRLTEAKRLQIVELLESENPPKMRKIARDFGVNEKSIRNVNKMREEIKTRNANTSETTRDATYRKTRPKFAQLEEILVQWLSGCRMQGLVIPPILIQTKALEIASKLNITKDSFSASNGWLQRFCIRNNILGAHLYGEGGEVDKNNPELLRELEQLETLIDKYDIENVYNMDETGLFFRMLPSYTLLMPGEDIRTARGKKVQKSRVTLTVCCNATGSHKIPLHMIGKPVTPACIVGRKWPLVYHNQVKAWMDREVFTRWFYEVFYTEIRRKTGRPVLLLMDNAPGHDTEITHNNITVKFFPPNVTSWKQPMDMGIIAGLKKRYKYRLLRDVIAYHDLSHDDKLNLNQSALRMRRGAVGVNYGKAATLLDAAQYAVEAWSDLSEQTLKNCFIKADVIPAFKNCQIFQEDENFDEFLAEFSNCSLIDRINMEELAEEIKYICHMDDTASPIYQQSLLEDVDDIISNADEGKVVSYHDEDEDDCDKSQEEFVIAGPPVEFKAVLSKVLLLSADFQSLSENHALPEAEMEQCFEYLFGLQTSMKRANSAIMRKAIRNSNQLTLHDWFKSK